MNKNYQDRQYADYESPSSEIWMLESRNIICTSGQLDGLAEDDKYVDGWN